MKFAIPFLLMLVTASCSRIQILPGRIHQSPVPDQRYAPAVARYLRARGIEVYAGNIPYRSHSSSVSTVLPSSGGIASGSLPSAGGIGLGDVGLSALTGASAPDDDDVSMTGNGLSGANGLLLGSSHVGSSDLGGRISLSSSLSELGPSSLPSLGELDGSVDGLDPLSGTPVSALSGSVSGGRLDAIGFGSSSSVTLPDGRRVPGYGYSDYGDGYNGLSAGYDGVGVDGIGAGYDGVGVGVDGVGAGYDGISAGYDGVGVGVDGVGAGYDGISAGYDGVGDGYSGLGYGYGGSSLYRDSGYSSYGNSGYLDLPYSSGLTGRSYGVGDSLYRSSYLPRRYYSSNRYSGSLYGLRYGRTGGYLPTTGYYPKLRRSRQLF